jgi:hypothetical protein
MANISITEELRSPRVLMFSNRNIAQFPLSRASLYEFEDIICKIDSVELLALQPGKHYDLRYRVANGRIARRFCIDLNPGIPRMKLKNDYDLLFTVCSFPKDLLNLKALDDWKDHCMKSVCLIDEFWIKQIPQMKLYLKILSQFDHVFLYYNESAKYIGEEIGDKCSFLPPGIDSFLFCPYPEPPDRVIDVYSFGRRSNITHQKLIQMANERNMFYVYDTRVGDYAINLKEHRSLMANMAKRSRYLIVNPGLVDVTGVTGKQQVIGNRYFEGAGSGAIMIGEVPQNEEFKKLFGWKDSVIQVPFNSDKIDEVIKELDNQPDRQDKIHRNNVIQSLRCNDWAYRWETILNTVGLKTMPNLTERKERLKMLSEVVEKEGNSVG